MLKNKIFKIIEDFPIEGSNRRYFVKDNYVKINADKFPISICYLCDEDGCNLYDNQGLEIKIQHHFEEGDPVWSRRIELFTGEDVYNLYDAPIEEEHLQVIELMEYLETFEGDVDLYLDYNETIERALSSEGMTITVLMQGITDEGISYKLIAVSDGYVTPIETPSTTDIDELLNSDSIESLTINFNK